jgi:hypothetical protein
MHGWLYNCFVFVAAHESLVEYYVATRVCALSSGFALHQVLVPLVSASQGTAQHCYFAYVSGHS